MLVKIYSVKLDIMRNINTNTTLPKSFPAESSLPGSTCPDKWNKFHFLNGVLLSKVHEVHKEVNDIIVRLISWLIL